MKDDTIQANFTLLCFSREFSDSEILSIIPGDILTEIKQNDPHPYFRAYVLAHTGESSPSIIDEKTGKKQGVKITWTEKAIQSMKDFIKRGIKFFRGHNADSSTHGRESLGEIVATKEIDINGKLSNVVVGYFPPETREEVKSYNVNSMEALWTLVKKAGKIFAEKMQKLTGVALGDSNIERPAFEGATVVGAVQAFENTKHEEIKEDMDNITFQDVRRAIQEMNIFPHQVFEPEKLKNDNSIKELMREKDNIIEEQKKELETKNKAFEKLTAENEQLKTGNLKITAKERYQEILKSEGEKLKLTEKQKAFLEKQAAKITDYTDEGIRKHFDSMSELYTESIAPVIEDNTEVKTPKGSTGEDYTKPENNPFIPKED